MISLSVEAVEFTAKPVSEYMNHLVVNRCADVPRDSKRNPLPVWECGKSSGTLPQDFPQFDICAGSIKMDEIFNSPMDQGVYNRFTLPQGTGISLKGYNFLVLQNHILTLNGMIDGWTKSAQVAVKVTKQGTETNDTKIASQFTFQVMGQVPAYSRNCVTGFFVQSDEMSVNVIAIHPHGHGSNVRQRVWQQHANGTTELLMDVDPRGNEHYHMLDKAAGLVRGDRITLQCLFDNSHSYSIIVGYVQFSCTSLAT